jgi:hypothetical protein
MKVFDLACVHEHRFEGWFGSADDYESQLSRGLLECPMCASRDVRKLPAAPRLNLSGATEPPRPRAAQPTQPETGRTRTGEPAAQPDLRAMQAMFMKMARELVANTEDVGGRFAEEARRIHYRESPERAIRGTASPEQARELVEEGIEVFSFPIPAALKEPVQ